LANGESADGFPDDQQARHQGQVFGKLYEKGADHARGRNIRFRANSLALLPMEHAWILARKRATGSLRD
jgi:hypothetical protein